MIVVGTPVLIRHYELRTVGILCDDVDPSRVGTIGMSMGSSMAQWLGALDPRITAVVDICCLVDYQTLIAEKGLGRHGIYYYVPSLLEHFTAAEINALIAPRPHLAITGLQDRLEPAAGVDLIDAATGELILRVSGGTSIIGGRGTVLGTLLGALLVGTVTSAVTLLTWPTELTQLFIGLFILVAVGVDLLRERRRSAT